MKYLLSIRPTMGIFAVIFSFVSFKVINQEWSAYAWLVYAIVFIGISATMVWNDYQDREADKLKGKILVSSNPVTFFRYSMTIWIILVALDCCLLIFGLKPFIFSIILNIYGFYYKKTKKFFLLPMLSVSLFCTLLAFFPSMYFMHTEPLWQLQKLLIFIFVFINVREIVKDLMDAQFDAGYKKTLPLKIGIDKTTKLVALLLVSLTFAFVYVITQMQTQPLGLKIIFIAINLVSFVSAAVLVLATKYKTCKVLMDIGGVSALLFVGCQQFIQSIVH